jgi:hypothetical protein
MVDVVEEAPDVGLGHLGVSRDERLPDDLFCLHRRPLRPEPERHRLEVGLEDRLHHDLGGGLSHPVTHRGDSQRSDPTCWFRDIHTPGRRGTIRPGPKISLQLSQQPLNPILVFDKGQGDPIHPSRSPVPTNPFPRLPQHVTPVDPVEQGVETAPLRLLGRSP